MAAVLVALGVGVAVGWGAFGRDTTAAKPQVPLCPGSQLDALERTRAAACLLDNYLALGSQAQGARDRGLAEIVLPNLLTQFRKQYRPVGSEFASHTIAYAGVAAVKLDQGPDAFPAYHAPDVAYRAWIAVAVNTSPPRTAWYLGHFAVRWQDNRWWLTGAFGYDSTVPTYTLDPSDTPFGDAGWVGA